MILINGQQVAMVTFPDGTPLIRTNENSPHIKLEWYYQSDSELFQIICLARHYKNKKLTLSMPYLPNARMDRVNNADEVFTLKHFSEVINALKFESVEVLDVHSAVGATLIEGLVNLSPKQYIAKAIKKIGGNVVLYFPDEGAEARYGKLFEDLEYCYGVKKRDWQTGKIIGLEIVTEGLTLKGKTVLMVDDICSYGGTFYYSAKALKKLGVAQIYSYATHTENSILAEKSKYYKLLKSGQVVKHFTAKSIFTATSEQIEIIE